MQETTVAKRKPKEMAKQRPLITTIERAKTSHARCDVCKDYISDFSLRFGSEGQVFSKKFRHIDCVLPACHRKGRAAHLLYSTSASWASQTPFQMGSLGSAVHIRSLSRKSFILRLNIPGLAISGGAQGGRRLEHTGRFRRG